MEHIKDIIQKKELAGTWIKCKYCDYQNAYISLEDRRWKVVCPQCRSEYYLKEQQNTPSSMNA